MKKYSPTTPSRRHMEGIKFKSILTAKEPEKSLTFGKKKTGARNSRGRITMRHKGGGHKRLLRDIDFRYVKKDIPAKVLSIEYDPNRTGFIALVVYKDGEKKYILAPQKLKTGDEIITSDKAEIKAGNRLPLYKISVGTLVYNVEVSPNTKAKLARSAGNYAELLAIDERYANIKLPSGEVRKVSKGAWASIGQVSNEENKLMTIGKAGRSRWLGIRPTVRGSAMNPVDHPYGGGEGRQKRGTRRPKNIWGKITGGVKTRNKKKYSKNLIIQRRKKK